MGRSVYKGFDLPDGAAVPDVPADLRTLVDGVMRVLDSWQATGDASSTGTTVAVPGTSRAVNIGPGTRRLRLDLHCAVATPSTPNNVGRVWITMDGAEVCRWQRTITTQGSASTTAETGASMSIVDNVAAGSHTFAMSVTRAQGAGTITVFTGARITVTDTGAAP